MIEEDSVADEHVVTLAVVNHVPVCGHFAHCIRAARIERGVLILRRSGCTKHLTGPCLVQPDLVSCSFRVITNCLKQPKRACSGYVGSVFGLIKRNPHMRLSCQIVNFIGTDLLDDVSDSGAVGDITGMQEEPCGWIMRIYIKMVDSVRVESRAATKNPVNLITFGKQ